MSIRVQLPPVLRSVMGGERWIEGEGATLSALLADLSARHPALGLHLLDEHGAIRRNIVCLHGQEAVRARDTAVHRIADGDEVVLTNALAGG